MSEYDDAARRAVPTELERALAAEVSLRSRMRYVAVGLAGASGAVLITVLSVTEPDPLPARTQAAFVALIAVGLTWAAFAGWTLSRRRPLFARDRVLGARLALAVSVGTCVVGTFMAATRGTTAETVATALTGGMLIWAAGLLLARARARRRALLRLVDALQETSTEAPPPPPDTRAGTPRTSGEAMNSNVAPIGPMAIFLRRFRAGNRTIVVVAAVLCVALLVGVALLVA